MNIGSIVGHPPDNRSFAHSSTVVSDCLVGVEVEVEGLDVELQRHIPLGFGKYWNLVHDGSLRNGGVEFVLKNPLSGKDLVDSLINLERRIKEEGWNPKMSDNTSVHVHLDVRNLSRDELRNLVILYTIFEKALFNYAGPDRRDNIFCTSFGDSQGIIELLAKQFDSSDDMFHINLGNFQKYSSCNLHAIADHGSLEFRNHEGEFKTVRLLRWINILLSMHKYVTMKRIVPVNISGEISQIGIGRFTKMVFGKFSNFLEYDELEEGVLDGIRLVQDLVYIDKIDYKEYTKDDSSLFEKYLKKLGKEAPKVPKPHIDEDWANIIFEGMEVGL